MTSRFISLPVAEDTAAGIPATASRFLKQAAVSIGRVVAKLPLVSKFLNYLSPPTMKLEPNGPKADALRAEVHREMAVAATPRLKPRFNRPAGPQP